MRRRKFIGLLGARRRRRSRLHTMSLGARAEDDTRPLLFIRSRTPATIAKLVLRPAGLQDGGRWEAREASCTLVVIS